MNDLGAQWSHDGTTEFAATPGQQDAFSSLAWLDIRANRLRDSHLTAFLQNNRLTRLVGLNLSGNQFFDSVHQIGRKVFPALRVLNLSHCDLRAADVCRLLEHSDCPRLKHLNIGRNSDLSDSVITALCDSPALKELTHLNLTRTGITPTGLQTLVDSPSPTELKWLNIGDMDVSPALLKALRKRFRGAVRQLPYH